MRTVYAPQAIDFSRTPPPNAIEDIDFDQLLAAAIARLLAEWQARRTIDPTLPEYTVEMLATDPAIITLRTWSGLRQLDRQRVNDGIDALLAVRAKGANLENITASRNVARQTIAPATATAAAVMEGDASLLKRYLRSFDKAAAGSRDRYLYEAMTAWPQNDDRTLGLWDARVNGFEIHGRRGDSDVVIIGPFGRAPTEEERLLVRSAVAAPHVKPDATSVSVIPAQRADYSVSLVIEVPDGPDPDFVVNEAVGRVRQAAEERMLIGGDIPKDLFTGAAYGTSVLSVRDLAPVVIAADPYTVPVLTSVGIVPEVRL